MICKCGIGITDWQRRQLILLHVEFREVIRPGEDTVWDAVAEVVLHVQVLQNQMDSVLLDSDSVLIGYGFWYVVW